MKAFEYAAPTSAQDALEALSGSEALALSGGTDLLSRMKDYVTSPDRVVYLKDIKDLCGIDAKDGGLNIRAGTRLVEIVEDKQIAKLYPALRQATLGVGTPQIRNMATIGGNLCQRPRCWFYRSGLGLLGLKDGKSLVREGDNRYHSIFLTDGNALFTSPSSLAVPLIALGAKATILGAKGERTLPLEDLYQVPKRDQDRELTIAPGELLLKVTIPAPKGKNTSYEVRQKQSHDWPLVLCSVNLETDDGKVGNSRVVLYGVAPTPWRSKAAEEALQGKELNRETAEAAAEAAVKDAKPLSMNGYKVPLTKTVVKRALLSLAGDRYWEEA
ncbi:MAG: FAD binding domain-containing protein [Isosphaeraceae bacterium]